MHQELHRLVKQYETGKASYLSDDYNEAQLRSDFLDPLFELLGWDIKNKSARPTNAREVVLEETLKSDDLEHAGKPDYTFRLYGERKFFLEAKRPCVRIQQDPSPARQIRRYGYTANLKISVLSNFEFLLIYDASVKVDENDSSTRALVRQYHYTEYEDKFDEIKQLIGRDAVYSGAFDEEWKDIEVRLNQWAVDQQFLKQINEWRLLLGKEILAADPSIKLDQLGDAVQSYINKILFLRVCEDRNIETYKHLLNIANTCQFDALLEKFRRADSRYNSGLFAKSLSRQVVCKASSAFWQIIRELYYPESPYSFGVFSSDMLGHIYEIFVAEKLAIRDGELHIVKKPENVDRDVVTTSTYIIREILRQTLLPLCEGKSANEILKLEIADIACGSGAFLLEAFQLLNDLLIDFYIQHDPSKLTQIGENTWKLNFAEKKKLLVRCIHGVDKDFNAVEACKFGLLLKLLENENSASVKGVRPILPCLESNIQWGNSLLSPHDIEEKDEAIVNPFDFNGRKFDAIIGNPPYLATEGMKNSTPVELPLYKQKYKSAFKQFDKYFVFVERALDLLKENGLLGYIVPLKFMKVGAGRELRRLISDRKALEAITSFGACQVFPGKTNYTCLLILKKAEHPAFRYSEVDDLEQWRRTDKAQLPVDEKPCGELSADTWVLFPKQLAKLYQAVWAHSVKLGEITGEDNIFNGIQTSANEVFVFRHAKESSGMYTFSDGRREWQVEKEVTRPYFQTSRGDDGLNTYRTFKPNAHVIFPYRKNGQGRLELIPLQEIGQKYPFLHKYLKAHKKVLASPKRDVKPKPTTKREWHRFGRHQSLDACNLPRKIIVGVLSTGDKYAVDESRTFVSSGGTAGYCMIALPDNSPYSIHYLQAILNSKCLEWISSLHGEVFRGGFIARGTKVLKQLPVRKIDFHKTGDRQAHNRIAKFQKQLTELGDKLDAVRGNKRQSTRLERKFRVGKQKLDKMIIHLYGLDRFAGMIPSIKEKYAVD